MKHSLVFFLAILLSLTALSGCGTSRATKYFLLTSTSQEQERKVSQPQDVELGPITIPRYLDRNGIVVRVSEQEFVVNDLFQWGEPLKENIGRVLRAELERCPQFGRVELFPWKNKSVTTKQIILDFSAFEKKPEGSVVVDVRYSSGGSATSSISLLNQCSSDDGSFELLARCMSEGLVALAKRICELERN